MRSSNPVLVNWAGNAQGGQTYAQRYGYPTTQPQAGYPPMAPPRVEPMTLDDVVVRTIGLLALTGLAGAVSWIALPDTGSVTAIALLGSLLAGLVLGLVIAFKRITNPVLIGIYAVTQGVLLGVVSRLFEDRYPGIVLQAVVGTFGVFAGMAVLYKFRVIRATPKFTKWVLGALFGLVGLMLLNFVLYFFDIDMGIRAGVDGKVGPLAWIFSIVAIGIAALTFILDFAMIEEGIRAGAPRKMAWYLAFALLVGLIFLYWEILRLLSYIRR